MLYQILNQFTILIIFVSQIMGQPQSPEHTLYKQGSSSEMLPKEQSRNQLKTDHDC